MKKQKPNNSNDCKLYLDHTPVWAGDGFYCSKCMLEFVPKKFISSEIQKEREKVLEEVREIIKTYEVKSILKFKHELLSKINSLNKK